jgi:hypothetical protein
MNDTENDEAIQENFNWRDEITDPEVIEFMDRMIDRRNRRAAGEEVEPLPQCKSFH